MAVIITDMNIPKTCGKCFLRCKVGDYRAPAYRCSITGEIIDFSDYISYKQSDCPLKSADEMFERIEKSLKFWGKDARVVGEVLAILNDYREGSAKTN